MEKLVEGLFDGNGEYPQKKLERLIGKHIREFIDNKFETAAIFFEDFYKTTGNLVKYLQNRIMDSAGLKFNAHIAPRYEDELESITVDEDFKEVFVSDYDPGLKVKYKALLEIDPDHKIKAILRFEERGELKSLVYKTVKKTFSTEVKLGEFLKDTEALKKKLSRRLEEALVPEGRKLAHFSIQTEEIVSDSEKEFILNDYDVECKLKDCTIQVKHDLIMNIDDLGKFKSSGIENLEEWVKRKLESFTRTALFGKPYLELILSYEEKNETFDDYGVKGMMVDAAEEIGFKVKQLITIPRVKPLELLNGFSFEVGENEDFTTLDTRIKVKLKVTVRGRIADLTQIEKYINPQVDITDKMKEKVVEGVKQVIDHTDPERYYIRFKNVNEELGDTQTVEEEIIASVTQKLRDEFFATEIMVLPKILDTDITKRFYELQSKFYNFQFDTFPFKEGGNGEAVSFKVKYQIKGVHPNGWHQFQSKQFGSVEEVVEQIDGLLKDHIVNTLNVSRSDEIIFKTYMDIQKLTELSNLLLVPIIAKTFGLIIEVISITRDATQIEKKRYDRLQKALETHDNKMNIEKETSLALASVKSAELNSLIEQYKQIKSIPELANSEEAEELKRKIENFESQFDEVHNQIEDNLLDQEEPEGNDLDELLEILKNNGSSKQIAAPDKGDEIDDVIEIPEEESGKDDEHG
ncbi:MAG: hypothetical protein KDD28_03440 [Phaeodactylibacter sp.]|nr:hypothetical protein [Phaeodactylibacter sp.]